MMTRLKFVLVVVENNDYQAAQAVAARESATRLDVDLEVVHIEHDAVMQSQQILKLLYLPAEKRPSAVLFEPVGTPLAQPARIAASTGVAWVVLNREVDYLAELRRQYKLPMFSISTNHEDVGRIQGEQIAHLLPHGGTVLHIEGPSDNNASVRRTAGMLAAKTENVEVRSLRGLWTEQSAYQAVHSWLKLGIGKDLKLGVVAAQNDAMALGARRAFEETAASADRDRLKQLAFIGCDGLEHTGQAAVRRGQLAATVIIPPNAGKAIETVVTSLRRGNQPAECIFTVPSSYPPISSMRIAQ
jgi:ribose transport system substrate-binding protein